MSAGGLAGHPNIGKHAGIMYAAAPSDPPPLHSVLKSSHLAASSLPLSALRLPRHRSWLYQFTPSGSPSSGGGGARPRQLDTEPPSGAGWESAVASLLPRQVDAEPPAVGVVCGGPSDEKQPPSGVRGAALTSILAGTVSPGRFPAEYRRPWRVSRSCSRWERVVPRRYARQKLCTVYCLRFTVDGSGFRIL